MSKHSRSLVVEWHSPEYMDNLVSMVMASNMVANKRWKHIYQHHCRVRDCIAKGMFHLECFRTNPNIINIITKGLEKIEHKQSIEMLNLDGLESIKGALVPLAHSLV